MSKVTTEKRTMRAHSNLVLQVIRSQAGTLAKAILEGVMNSIDQAAENITVTINSGLVRIHDDGRGFAGQAVKEVFEEFGNPHPMDEEGFAKDTTYGKFRIGRGQMFAFGRNIWRSYTFCMVTDINQMQLDYLYEEGHDEVPGCTVDIELYDSLSLRAIQDTIDQVTRLCRYVSANLVVNGKRVSVDPATMKWDIVNDLAYINKKTVEHRWRGGNGLDIYQLGVFVMTLPVSKFGLEGTVVTRQEIGINFARNEMLDACPRWKKISAMLKEEGIKSATTKPKLNRHEARNIVEEFSGGEGGVPYAVFYKTACLPDVTGRMWSPEQLYKLIHSRASSPRVLRDADGCIRISFAPKGSLEAEKVMQLKRAVVLDESVLEHLRVDHIEDLEPQGKAAVDEICGKGAAGPNGLMFPNRFDQSLIWADYRELLKEDDGSDTDLDYHRFGVDEYTQREEDFVHHADLIVSRLSVGAYGYRTAQERRTICIGRSKLTTAWTDGATHITFDRAFIADLDMGMERDWFKLGLMLCRLVCFTEDSTRSGEVMEDIEFLQNYAAFTEKLPDLCRNAYQAYARKLTNRLGKLPKAMQSAVHRESEARALQTMAYAAEPENMN